MFWADNRSIATHIIFREGFQVNKHISSCFYFFKGDIQVLFIVGESGTITVGVESCRGISFLNSRALCGGVGAIWVPEEEALNELLFVLLQRCLN